MGSTNECVVTLVERQNGYLRVGKIRARTTAEFNRVTFALMCRHSEKFRTITADNGTEFHDYRSLEAATGVPFTSPPRTTPRSAAPTKTSTGCCASNCPEEPAWPH